MKWLNFGNLNQSRNTHIFTLPNPSTIDLKSISTLSMLRIELSVNYDMWLDVQHTTFILQLGETSAQFIERRIMFSPAPLHLTSIKSALLQNTSQNHAFFQVSIGRDLNQDSFSSIKRIQSALLQNTSQSHAFSIFWVHIARDLIQDSFSSIWKESKELYDHFCFR